jgi:hypothetical protein
MDFVKDVDDHDIIGEPLALVIFERRFFMQDEPLNVNAPLVSSLRLYSFAH